MNVELTDPLTEEEMCSCEALKEHLIELELLTADSNAIVYENEWHSQINLVLEQMNTELNGMDVSQNDIMKKYVCFSYFRFTQSLTLIFVNIYWHDFQDFYYVREAKEDTLSLVSCLLENKSVFDLVKFY